MSIWEKISGIFRKAKPVKPLTLDEITAALDNKLNSLHGSRSILRTKIEAIRKEITSIEGEVKGIGNKLDTIMTKIKDF